MTDPICLSEFLDDNNVDICVVYTEHNLMSNSLQFMHTINTKYKSFSTADTSLDCYGQARCGKGGVSILFKKKISRKICTIETAKHEGILGTKFVTRSTPPLFILGVYIPADSHTDSYLESLACLNPIHSNCAKCGDVVLLGDFNAKMFNANVRVLTNSSAKDNAFNQFLATWDLSPFAIHQTRGVLIIPTP